MTSNKLIYFTVVIKDPHIILNKQMILLSNFPNRKISMWIDIFEARPQCDKKMNILIRFMQYSARYTIERKELLQNRCFYTEQCKSILLIVVKSCMNNKTSIMNAWLVEQTVSIKRYILIPLKIFSQLYYVASLLFFPVACSFPEVTHTHNREEVAYCIA